MANIKFVFQGTENSKEHELQCYANTSNEIFISIDMGVNYPAWISLDESTAIKLAKKLRAEINKIKEGN